MPSNVKATGEVIKRYRTDSRHEDTVEHTFKHLEYFAIETAGMGQCPIHLFTMLIKHHIGEIIIFIHYKIEMNS